MIKEVVGFKQTNGNWSPSYYFSHDDSANYVKVSLRDISSPAAKNSYKVIVSGRDNYAYSIIYESYLEATGMFSGLMLKEFVDVGDLITLGFKYD